MSAVARSGDDLVLAPALPAPSVPPAPANDARPLAPLGSRPATRAEALGFLAMVFGMFMAILDIQIVSSSIAEIRAGLGASVDEVSWVQTAYLIAEVVMIPLSGFLSRVLSTRVLYVISVSTFTLASAGCALATSIESMIVLRALQGFLGGAMIPTTFAAAYMIFPPDRRNVMSVVIGLVATMAPTIGPTLGGYLTQVFSWHWLFLINVVPGVIVAWAVWASPPMDKPNRSLLKGLDLIGLAAMALFLGSLEYVLEEGPGDDWFDDGTILMLAVISVAGAAIFFWRSLTYRNPIVDLSAFANRNFATGSVFSFCVGIGLYGMVYLLPLYLGTVRGMNSLQIGEMLFVTGLAQFLSAPIAGNIGRKLDPRVPLVIGFLMMACSTWLLSGITADWDFYELMWPQILRGVGVMIAMIPVNSLALGTLPPDKLKSASGLYNLMRNLGGAVGLAALNTLLTDREAFHWSHLAESINPARPEVQATLDGLVQRFTDQGLADPEHAALKVLGGMVQTQANVMSYGDAFTVLTYMFIAAACLIPFVRRPRRAGVAGGGGH